MTVRSGRPTSGKRAAVRPPSYAQQLMTELDALALDYIILLARSSINNTNLDRGGRSGRFVFIGYAEWHWAPSDAAADSAWIHRLGLAVVAGRNVRMPL